MRHYKHTLSNTPDNFTAGKIALHLVNWKKLTSDPWVLNAVKGIDICFEEKPRQYSQPKPIKFSETEIHFIDKEIEKLLQKNVIQLAERTDDGSFVSNIFIRMKKDNSVRLILNLKKLNEYIEVKHFKMDTLKSAVTLMKPGVFFASCDLKDAYYSVNVKQHFRKYLSFIWKTKMYNFCSLPNGLCVGPRIFTKLLKCVYSHLRKKGFINTGYIDDSLLQGDTYEQCDLNMKNTVHLFDSLGLTVHPEKSVFVPTQIIEFLGFILNSVSMTVCLSGEKAQKIIECCINIVGKPKCTIRDLSKLIGKFVACSPAVPHAALYYKRLEIFRNDSLKTEKGNYEAIISLPGTCINDINWWKDNIKFSQKSVYETNPDIHIFSDSSLTGWGGVMNDKATSGIWSANERNNHINYLELKAVLLTLQSFCKDMSHTHIRIRTDNTVSVTCINKQGSSKVKLNDMTREIWQFAIEHNLWLTAEHVPGVENSIADFESRKNNIDTEWMLKPSIFCKITKLLGHPDIDLFATRLNKQVQRYYSWQPDPGALAIDAFKQKWGETFNYLFPPFSVIGQALQKIEQDSAEAILIAPVWPTQVWFPRLLTMLVDCPYFLPVSKDLLTVPNNEMTHPLLQKLHLAVFRVSGKLFKRVDFRKMLSTLSCAHGVIQQKRSMGDISKDGCIFATNGVLTPFHIM